MTVAPIILVFVALAVVIGIVLIVVFTGHKTVPYTGPGPAAPLSGVGNVGVGNVNLGAGSGSGAIVPVNTAAAAQFYSSACGNCPAEIPQCGNSLDVMDTAVSILGVGATPCF